MQFLHEEFKKIWAKVIAKAWNDEKFKKRLLENPKEVMIEHGASIPKDVNIEIHEDSPSTIHLNLPLKPTDEISKVELENLAGGASCFCPSTGH